MVGATTSPGNRVQCLVPGGLALAWYVSAAHDSDLVADAAARNKPHQQCAMLDRDRFLWCRNSARWETRLWDAKPADTGRGYWAQEWDDSTLVHELPVLFALRRGRKARTGQDNVSFFRTLTPHPLIVFPLNPLPISSSACIAIPHPHFTSLSIRLMCTDKPI